MTQMSTEMMTLPDIAIFMGAFLGTILADRIWRATSIVPPSFWSWQMLAYLAVLAGCQLAGVTLLRFIA